MTLEEAAKWVDKNCTDETVARLRSRAVAKTLFDEVRRQEELIHDLFDEVRRQEELIHDLAGVLWRLEDHGYIGYEVDDDERGQCDHSLRKLLKGSRDAASAAIAAYTGAAGRP